MKQFRHYFQTKLNDTAFCDLFDKECHVCAYTVKIFEKMTAQNIDVDDMAQMVASTPEAIVSLMNADHCMPHLVVRLCQTLDLPSPPDCPRMQAVLR
ncbi:MAG: hypothetical protein JXR76_02370 [Deltaproteobacteria bacterium]|nr:hypothetical protein [Deltaproteobacteria bacterium]